MFKEVIQLLSHFPSLGRELEDRKERFFIKEHYQIFYLDEADSIIILHIWDSRRDPENLEL